MVAIATSPTENFDLTGELWSSPLPREHGFEPLEVSGRIPAELTGTLFRNGPGTVGVGRQRYRHPFEADGQITAMRIGNGRVLGASKVTGSPELDEERRAGKLLYNLSTSTPRRIYNLLRGKQKNTANTSVMIWQDRLFATVESSKPTELAPADLTRLGESDLGGVVVGAFSAHPHRVAARRAIYNFGVEQGRKTQLVAYELPDVGAARELARVALAGPTMLHDFIATPNHLVWFVSPVRIDVPRMLLGKFNQMFKWQPELGTEVIVMPIDRPTEVVRFTTDAFYQWHFANAFERGNDLVIDYVRYPSFATFDAIGVAGNGGTADALEAGRYHRATIRGKTMTSEQLFDRACEFPTLAPGRAGTDARTNYLVLGDLAAIGKLDPTTGELVTHELPADHRTTEPIFVPRPGATRDDDGHVLALQHDERRAFLAIYDAARLPDGPVARAYFDHQIPITFHGQFSRTL